MALCSNSHLKVFVIVNLEISLKCSYYFCVQVCVRVTIFYYEAFLKLCPKGNSIRKEINKLQKKKLLSQNYPLPMCKIVWLLSVHLYLSSSDKLVSKIHFSPKVGDKEWHEGPK